MPTNNRFKTVATIADEDFQLYADAAPVTAVGDLVVEDGAEVSLDAKDESGNIVAKLSRSADQVSMAAGPHLSNWRIVDGALAYSGLRARGRIKIQDHGLGDLEFTSETYVIKCGQVQILFTRGGGNALKATAAIGNADFGPVINPEDFSLVVAPDEELEFEMVYHTTGNQAIFRLTGPGGSETIRMPNQTLLAETLVRVPGEIALYHSRVHPTSSVVETAMSVDDIVVEKVTVGRPPA